jgi:hypothetical protein
MNKERMQQLLIDSHYEHSNEIHFTLFSQSNYSKEELEMAQQIIDSVTTEGIEIETLLLDFISYYGLPYRPTIHYYKSIDLLMLLDEDKNQYTFLTRSQFDGQMNLRRKELARLQWYEEQDTEDVSVLHNKSLDDF